MLDDLRIKILYQFKILEYKFQAWFKGFEISKAYSQKRKPIEVNRLLHIPRRLVVYTSFLVLGIGAVWGTVKLIQLKPVSNPEAAIFNRKPDQSRPEFPNQDSVLSNKDVSAFRDTTPVNSQIESVNQIVDKGSVAEPNEKKPTAIADYFILLANKADKTLYLLQNSAGKWQVLQYYSMGTGAQAGRKKNAGDKRTPEGYYFIIDRKEKRQLASIYGPLAYVLDYPNQEDRMEGRTGQGIWIHGTEPDSAPGETKGCLEIANNQLLELSTFLKDGIGTPVIIVDKAGIDDPLSIPDYNLIDRKRQTVLAQRKQFNEEFKVLLENWEAAWESMDINQYKQFYDTSGFYSQGVYWKGWMEKKVRTFEIYSSIDISIDNILVSDNSENMVTLKFLQIYKSDKNSMENGKQLVLEKKNGSWKITREVTIPKEELLL